MVMIMVRRRMVMMMMMMMMMIRRRMIIRRRMMRMMMIRRTMTTTTRRRMMMMMMMMMMVTIHLLDGSGFCNSSVTSLSVLNEHLWSAKLKHCLLMARLIIYDESIFFTWSKCSVEHSITD